MAREGELYQDQSISEDAWLLRRIHPTEHLTQGKFDKSKRRLSSGAFNDSSDDSGMSAHLESTIVEQRGSPERALDDYPDHYLVRFRASLAMKLKMKFVRREGDTSGHVFVVGKKTGGVRNLFRDNCEWVVKPPDLEE